MSQASRLIDDFEVADLSLAAAGRLQIELAETEMPGLMALRAAARGLPAAGRSTHHRLAAHDRADRGADRDAGRISARRCAGRPATSSPPRMRPRLPSWWGAMEQWTARGACPCSHGRARRLPNTGAATIRALRWPDGPGPTLIVDDGGDATLMVHLGARYESQGGVPSQSVSGRRRIAASPDEVAVHELLDEIQRTEPGLWDRESRPCLRGVSEETTTGVNRLYEMESPRGADLPRLQRQRLGHEVQVRQSLRLPALADRWHQPGHRRDARAARWPSWRVTAMSERAVRAGAARPGLPGHRLRDRPHQCACRRAMEGFEVDRLENVLDIADIYVTATGNRDIISAEHMTAMKHQAVVANIGHFDNEIDMAGLAAMSDVQRRTIKPQVDEFVFPSGNSVIVLPRVAW